MSLQRCESCLRPTPMTETGARAFIGTKRYIWCLECWDDNPLALNQYRNIGTLALQKASPPRA